MKHSPYEIVDTLEKRIAEWAGSKYAVAIESCTMAIFLCFQYEGIKGEIISLPKFTYPGVCCSVINAGGKLKFRDEDWEGLYFMPPTKVVDGALRFKKGMYVKHTLHCLSFHIKKRMNVGRGGMVLTDDENAYNWLKKARFDGRKPVPLREDDFEMIGWNAYMTPSDASRAIQVFEILRDKDLPDLPREEQGYVDLSKFKIYQ